MAKVRGPNGAHNGIRRGYSTEITPRAAVKELYDAIIQPDIELAVFFCSSSYDLDELAAEVRSRFAGINVIGCTTAGEITPVGYLDGSITGFSIAAGDCWAVTERIVSLCRFEVSQGRVIADSLVEAMARRGQAVDPADTFALLLIDGMSTNEEVVLSAIHRRIDTLPLFGGSAGDGLRLQQTFVFHEGQFHADAALLTIIKTSHPFKVFRCQHFAGSTTRVVVTAADPAGRVVHELDAEPAAEVYARLIDVDRQALTPTMFAESPLMVKIGGDFYVRSIQSANPDGSLTFFCAIDEGVVLTLGQREDVLKNLRALFASIRQEVGKPELVIGFDCVLRGLEFQARQLRHLATRALVDNNVIGFSTYGEQFGAMHVNQTFTGIAIGRRLTT